MSLLPPVRERRSKLANEAQGLIDVADAQNRGLSPTEGARFDANVLEIRSLDARISELEFQEKREANAAASRVASGEVGPATGLQRGYHVGGGTTYTPAPQSPSFFADLYNATRGDANASDRLRRNNVENGTEQRALASNVTGGASEFAPPLWQIENFVALARPGRVTANLFHQEPLPNGVSSVNIPKVSTGTTEAVQTAQNTSLSQTDMTTTSLSTGITTIGGKAVISLQLLLQGGGPGFDQVILKDLAADYSKQSGIQALYGSGTGGQLRGYFTPASTNIVTWTQATPTVAGFYGQLAKLQSQIYSSRFVAPDTVVMHPRRWAWFASGVDSQGRPLVVPTDSSGGFNSMASTMGSVEAGHVGNVLGMQVYTDPNIATNVGAGTNQDQVLMTVRDDIWMYEGSMRMEAFDAPYADSAGILYRVMNFLGMIPDRYLASLGQITGTGLVSPVFAS
jgi:HK97 family phage major capsid protein